MKRELPRSFIQIYSLKEKYSCLNSTGEHAVEVSLTTYLEGEFSEGNGAKYIPLKEKVFLTGPHW